MKITAIKQQLRREGRYSIFVDSGYAFSLGTDALLESKLVVGQEISKEQLKKLKRLSDNDKMWNQTLRYVALRPRSQWEVEFYLRRKKILLDTIAEILNRLSEAGLIDDRKFAEAFVNDRRLLRPTARRKLVQELRQKHVADEIIQAAVGDERNEELVALGVIIEQKRRQPKYRDDLKLMQYLARQGFGYGDIKAAIKGEITDIEA